MAAAILLIPLISGAHAQEPRPADADVIKTFDEISAPRGGTPGPQDNAMQWRRDIRFGVLSKGAAKTSWVELVAHTIAELEPLLPVKVRYSTDSTNFAVIFVDDIDDAIKYYRPVLLQIFRGDQGVQNFHDTLTRHPLLCNNVTVAAQGAIGNHLVWVYTKAPKPESSVENCLKRSIAKGLGIGRHDTTTQSVFNPRLDLRDYSPIDMTLLKTFFAAAIPAGTPVEEARKLFERQLRADAQPASGK